MKAQAERATSSYAMKRLLALTVFALVAVCMPTTAAPAPSPLPPWCSYPTQTDTIAAKNITGKLEAECSLLNRLASGMLGTYSDHLIGFIINDALDLWGYRGPTNPACVMLNQPSVSGTIPKVLQIFQIYKGVQQYSVIFKYVLSRMNLLGGLAVLKDPSEVEKLEMIGTSLGRLEMYMDTYLRLLKCGCNNPCSMESSVNITAALEAISSSPCTDKDIIDRLLYLIQQAALALRPTSQYTKYSLPLCSMIRNVVEVVETSCLTVVYSG